MESSDILSEYEIDKPISSLNHSRIERRLHVLLTPYEDRFDIMPQLSLELLGEKTTPDISICSKLNYDWTRDEIRLKEAPVSTIEIISPKQVLTDVTDKIFQNYLPAGIQSAWIVIPALRSIHILLPNNQILTFSSGLVKDPATQIEINIAEIFI